MTWKELIPKIREEYPDLVVPCYDVEPVMKALSAYPPTLFRDALSHAIVIIASNLADGDLRPTKMVSETVLALRSLFDTFAKLDYDPIQFWEDQEPGQRNEGTVSLASENFPQYD
ncbi:MAG: hypothetical protein HDT02_03695 [Bacteroidales bacterium]|nr:hypothetical protein [Bacteroidales bacterium]